MNYSFLNICPNKTCGFANQLYSIVGMCIYAIENKINYIYLSKFLKQINSDNFCNISEVIDIKKTNDFLKKFNIVLFDCYNINLSINYIKYINGPFNIDLTEIAIKKFKNNNSFIINKDTNIPNLINYKNNNLMENNLLIEFKIDETIFNYCIAISPTGNLLESIYINLNEFTFDTIIPPINNGTEKFEYIIKNITFKEIFLKNSKEFIEKNIDLSKKVNVIHLRLEEDAISAWGKENKFDDLTLYKKKVSDKYIEIIKKYIDKTDFTIIISYNYKNDVIDYMEKYNYQYFITPKYNSYRDLSAIYDMNIGQYCNNVYICVMESSFSFTLLYRLYNRINVKIICLNLLQLDNVILYNFK